MAANDVDSTRGPDLLAYLYLNPEDSDFCIVVGEVKLPVHKCILAPQSTFFHDMIYSTLNIGGEVDFSAHSVDVVKAMLSWMYKGEVDDMDVVCEELLPLAQMCELDDLASACGSAMGKQLTPENLFEMYRMANLLNLNSLKSCCGRFLQQRKSEVFETAAWEKMCADDPLWGLFKQAMQPTESDELKQRITAMASLLSLRSIDTLKEFTMLLKENKLKTEYQEILMSRNSDVFENDDTLTTPSQISIVDTYPFPVVPDSDPESES